MVYKYARLKGHMQKLNKENNKLLVGLIIIFYARYYHFRNIEKITKENKNSKD